MLATVVYNLGSGELWLSVGRPNDGPFHPSRTGGAAVMTMIAAA
jgi:hypothetical protein